MDLFFWIALIGSIGILAFIVILAIVEETKAKKFRKTLKIGDIVKVHLGDKGRCIAEVTDIKQDDLKSVILSVTTTIDKIYPSK